MAEEACGYAAELKEAADVIKSLASQYYDLNEDLDSVLKAEGELLACLRLHANEYFGTLSMPSPPERPALEAPNVDVRDMDCREAIRTLLALRSRESSLTFLLSELRSFVINEVVRLAGLIGLCRHFEPDLADKTYATVLDVLVRKYLGL
ncbi:MAG: hypothetical protein ACP5HK_00275 [Acidilobus sp.]